MPKSFSILRNKMSQEAHGEELTKEKTLGASIVEGAKAALESVKNLKNCKGCARRRKKLSELTKNLQGRNND